MQANIILNLRSFFVAVAFASFATVRFEKPTSAQSHSVKRAAPFYYRPGVRLAKAETVQTDVCIYGGNSAGVVAALQLSRLGKKAIILENSNHLGGVSAGGLGETDIGNKAAIGGIAHEFYRRVGQKYGMEEEWRFEPHIAEQVFKDMVAESKTPVFYGQFLKSVEKSRGRIRSITLESGLRVQAKIFIDASYEGDLMAKSGVKYATGRESNATYGETFNGFQLQKGHQFDLPVDPYLVEGDSASGLLPGISAAGPGVPGSGDKRIQAYNFRLCLTDDPDNRIPFEKPAGYNPQEYVLLARYLQAGWPESEVFRKFDPIHNSFQRENSVSTTLQADDLNDTGAWMLKLKKAEGPLTRYLKERFSPELQAGLDAYQGAQPPANELKQSLLSELNRLIQGELLYSPERFAKVSLRDSTRKSLQQNLQGEDLARLNRTLLLEAYPNDLGPKKYAKVDKNNHGAVSTDYIGGNYAYPEADYRTREKIFQAHVTYQKGLMWFLGNDPSVPQNIRTRWSQWGLAKDEFPETGGWPHQLYVREARRMISDYVMAERNCVGREVVSDAVGLAAYTMDSHNVQRFVQDGRVWNEGDVQAKGFPPYPISYRSIVPKKAECENLLVPVCLAASHIAYGSIRMEPVFMGLAQSSATAASIAIDRKIALQDVPYPVLKTLLQKGQQILSWQQAPQSQAQPATLSAGKVSGSVQALKAFFARLRAGQNQTVVVYGTSLTRNGAWTNNLKQWFDQQFPGKVNFINSGISGKNSDDGVLQIKTQLLDHHPDLAFIEFSINDAHLKFKMPVERSAANLNQIVSAVRQQNPNAAVVLQIMNLPWDAPNGNRSFSDRPQLEKFSENYRDYARQHPVTLLDNSPSWQQLKNNEPEKFHAFLPDGLHPNRDGESLVTWPNLKSLLEKVRDAR